MNKNKNKKIELLAIPDLPLVKEGDILGQLIARSCKDSEMLIENGDILVIAQKIVSKSEGSIVSLESVTPSKDALELSHKTGRDPKLCQIYIDESERIVEIKGGRVISKHKLGFICSSAGVDKGNIPHGVVSLLPKNPDISAKIIREWFKEFMRIEVAIIISDSFGRPDRRGSVGISIGAAGISYLKARPAADLYGRQSIRQIAITDELAAAASLIMGQGDESLPVVLIKGVDYDYESSPSISDILED